MKRPLAENADTPVDAFIGKASTQDVVDIGARIKAARQALGLTQDALAALAGAKSKSGLQDNEAGKNMPGGQMIRALIKAGINANWLLNCEGPMMLADLAQKPVAPAINVDALVQAFCVSLQTAPPGESVQQSARKAVAFYQYCLDNGMITPEGEGTGNTKAAS